MGKENRYRREYPLREEPQANFDRIYRYLLSQGFKYMQFQGEQVFRRGNGWLTAPTFVKVVYTADTVRVEAWIKLALLPGIFVGEYGLEGKLGFAAKGPMKRAVAWLDQLLSGDAADSQAAAAAAGESAGTILPQGGAVTPAQYRRDYAPQRFHKDVKSLCIAGYVLIGISTVSALVSNPVALVDSVLMLALVLMIHLRKSRSCVIGLLSYSIFNCVVGMILYGMPAGYLWIILSIALHAHFNQADKACREAEAAAESAAPEEPEQPETTEIAQPPQE